MTIGAQPEVHEVELGARRDHGLIGLEGSITVHWEKSRAWLDALDEHFADHPLVRVRVVRRHAALVPDEALDASPVEPGPKGQLSVTLASRGATRQHEAEP